MAPGAAYDAKRGMLVVFGGSGPDGYFGDTWGWDGSTWTRLAETGPAPRVMGAMATVVLEERYVQIIKPWSFPPKAPSCSWDMPCISCT